jgi:hypothetical protein
MPAAIKIAFDDAQSEPTRALFTAISLHVHQLLWRGGTPHSLMVRCTNTSDVRR